MVSHMKVLSKKQENYFTVGKVGKAIVNKDPMDELGD